MRRPILGLLAAVLWALPALAQVPLFPQTLPPNTVVGRLGAGTAGPAQALPFNLVAAGLLNSLCTTPGAFPVRTSSTWQCSTVAGSTASLLGGPLTIKLNSTDAPVVADVGASTGILFNAFLGSSGSPYTTSTNPTVQISRVETISGGGNPVQNAALLVGAHAVSQSSGTQTQAVMAVAVKDAASTGDVVGSQGLAYHFGNSGTAFGSFFLCINASSSVTANCIAMETQTTNGSGVSRPYSPTPGTIPANIGLDIAYVGTSGGSTAANGGPAIQIRANGAAQQWDVGIGFMNNNPIATADIQSDTSATSLWFANSGAHTYGLNWSSATFSTYSILLPGYTISGTGAPAQSINQNAATVSTITNNSTGVNAVSYLQFNNNVASSYGLFGFGGGNYTGISSLVGNRAFIDVASAAAGFVINNEGANPTIIAVSSAESARFSSTRGELDLGVSATAGGALKLYGATQGSLTLKGAANVAANSTITLPNGTTDFSATGGTSQVVKQITAGAAFTVARLACADLSDAAATCSSATGESLVVGTTAISSGTNTRILYDNSGVLGEYTLTGSGTVVAMQTAPTFITSATVPLVIGGSGTIGTQLTVKTTTGNGTTDQFAFVGGNNGGTTFGTWAAAGLQLTSAGSAAFAVGRQGGSTGPAFSVNAATASQTAGLKITGAALNGTVAAVVTDTSGNTNLTIDALGSGTIGIAGTSTGAVSLSGISQPTSATSGGIPYYSSNTAITSSGALASGAVLLGGGAGSAPTASVLCTMTSVAMTCSVSSAFAPAFTMQNTAADASGGYFIAQKSRTGAAVQSGDTLGSFGFEGYANGGYQNAAFISTLVTAAPSGSNVPTAIQFQVTSASLALSEQMRLHASGCLSVGTMTDCGAGNLLVLTNVKSSTLTATGLANTATTSAVCYNTGTGVLTYDGTIGTCTVSLLAAKNLVEPLSPSEGLRIVMAMEPWRYTMKEGLPTWVAGEQIGFIADYAQDVDPRIVARNHDGTLAGMRYEQFTAVLTAAFKALKADNDNLRAEIEQVKRRLAR